MKIFNINNNHKIMNTILWQYEKAPRIVNWVTNLSDFGYANCGKIFDDILNGIINLYKNPTAIAVNTLKPLCGALGFDWSSPADIGKCIGAFFQSRMYGKGLLAEFDVLAATFSFQYAASQLSWGGLVRISFEDTTAKELTSHGIPIPFSVNESVEESGESYSFVFSDSPMYKKNINPRLATDVEESFFEKGGVGSGEGRQMWTLDQVQNCTIWSVTND